MYIFLQYKIVELVKAKIVMYFYDVLYILKVFSINEILKFVGLNECYQFLRVFSKFFYLFLKLCMEIWIFILWTKDFRVYDLTDKFNNCFKWAKFVS